MTYDRAMAMGVVTDDLAEDGFADWVRPHIGAMAALAGRLAPSADRDDIVQEALARAWKKRATFDPQRGTARVWLLAITADQARHARGKRPGGLIQGIRPVDSIDERVDLERVVAQLPPRQRLAVDCFYYVDLSVAETAALMGCSEGTVKSTLSDARRNIRRALEADQ